MKLPGSRRGPWTIEHESARNVWAGQKVTWTTVVRHDSGWQLDYDETLRHGVITTPDGQQVAVIEIPAAGGAITDRLIATLVGWIDDNAARLGQPSLEP